MSPARASHKPGALQRAVLLLGCGLAGDWAARGLLGEVTGAAIAGAVDGSLLIALASLAWKPKAAWPLILVALQGLVVAVDLLSALEPDLRPATPSIARVVIWSGLVATLAYATFTSPRAKGLSS